MRPPPPARRPRRAPSARTGGVSPSEAVRGHDCATRLTHALRKDSTIRRGLQAKAPLVGAARGDPVRGVYLQTPGVVPADPHLEVVQVDGDAVPARQLVVVAGGLQVLLA